MPSSVPGMMPKRGAMTPARAVWTIESQTTLSHWSHSAAALASVGHSGGPSKGAVDVARDGGRFVEREIAVLHHRDLAQWIDRRGFARPCRDQLVVDAFLAGGETRRAGERTGRNAVDLDGGHRDVLVQAASRGLSAGSVANTLGRAAISRAQRAQFGAKSAIAFSWGISGK